jgi:hypothetical protein
MTGQHGRHQALWDALVDYAAAHRDGTCRRHTGCATSEAVLHEHRAVIETAIDPVTAIRELLNWLAVTCAQTILTNARTTSADAGSAVMISVDGSGPIGRACSMLITTHLADTGELEDLLDACTASPTVAGEISSALVRQLATSLIERLEQLGKIGAHP